MTSDEHSHKVTVIGCGKLGGILATRWADAKIVDPAHLRATVRHTARAEALADTCDFAVSTDNVAAISGADVVVLCVKPSVIPVVAEELHTVLDPDTLVISVAAAVTTGQLEERLEGDARVVRAMPNTPAAVGEAMTALCAGKNATEADVEVARQLFDLLGRTVIVDEHHFDAVTGLSASGPAFVYVILESLAEAGVKVGLPRDIATLLAAQTVLGSARTVLESGSHPALLKDEVTTPAGCTVDGLLELEEGKLRVTLIKAVVRATERAGKLG